MSRRITARAIIVNEQGKLFSVRQKNLDGLINSFWSTPGGGLDDLESLENGLHRELVVETGVSPQIGRLIYIQQYRVGSDDEQLEFFFQVLNAKDYENINLSKTTHGELELTEFGFIDPRKEKILPEFLSKEDLTNLPKTVKIISYL